MLAQLKAICVLASVSWLIYIQVFASLQFSILLLPCGNC